MRKVEVSAPQLESIKLIKDNSDRVHNHGLCGQSPNRNFVM